MPKLALAFLLPLLVLGAPANATGGMTCRTAGPQIVEINLGFGHVPSAGLFLSRLSLDGKEIEVEAPQWWMNGVELRLALVSRLTGDNVAILKATWNETTHSYDGTLEREKHKRWIRCREA